MPPLPNKVEANALTPKELGVLKQWILEGAAGGAGGTGEKIQWQPIPSGMKSILSVALSRWGRFIAAGRANQIVVYDVILGQEVARLTDPKLSELQFDGRPMYPDGAADRDFIQALAFSPDESLLAAGGYRVVKLWKRPQNVQRQSATLVERPTAVAVSPDGTLIAVATADKINPIADCRRRARVRKLSGPTAANHECAILGRRQNTICRLARQVVAQLDGRQRSTRAVGYDTGCSQRDCNLQGRFATL